jgi:hypothetical protein
MDLKDFFSAAEARIDRWCEMNTVGRAWVQAAPLTKRSATLPIRLSVITRRS